MRQNLENIKNINNIYTSTDSYNSCRDNSPINTIQRTPPFSRSEDISSDSYSTIPYKKLIQSRKMTNNDLFDTDISLSTYEDDNSSTSPNYHYNSDGSFKLSFNSSSSSVKKQQHKLTEHNNKRIHPNFRKHKMKKRKGTTKKVIKFQKVVDKYISKREKTISHINPSCKSPHKNNNMNKKSFITTKKKTRHLGIQKIINTNNNHLDGKPDQTHNQDVNSRSHKSKIGIRKEKDKPTKSNKKLIDYGEYFKYSTTQIRHLTRMDIMRENFLAIVRQIKIFQIVFHIIGAIKRARVRNKIQFLARSFLRMT